MALKYRVGRPRTPASVFSQQAKIKFQQLLLLIWFLGADRDTVITVTVIRVATRSKKRATHLFKRVIQPSNISSHNRMSYTAARIFRTYVTSGRSSSTGTPKGVFAQLTMRAHNDAYGGSGVYLQRSLRPAKPKPEPNHLRGRTA